MSSDEYMWFIHPASMTNYRAGLKSHVDAHLTISADGYYYKGGLVCITRDVPKGKFWRRDTREAEQALSQMERRK